MEIEKLPGFRVNGQMFDSEQAAKDHLFEIRLKEWWDGAVCTELAPDTVIARILADRMKLLPIFKLLKDGNPVTAPRPVAPEIEPVELVDVEMRLIEGGKP